MITSFTVEVKILGFISNMSDFARFVSISKLPQCDKTLITQKATFLDIYYSRNKLDYLLETLFNSTTYSPLIAVVRASEHFVLNMHC